MTQDEKSSVTDDAVHAAMVEIHQDMLRFLTRRLGNKDEATEVSQDFFVKVLSKIGDVRDTQKLRAWMYRVIETTLIDYYRAQGKNVSQRLIANICRP